jgi:murein L,D-transpeptidase YafK
MMTLFVAAALAGPPCAPDLSGLPTLWSGDRARGPAVIVVDKSERTLGLYGQGALRTVDGRPDSAPICFPVQVGFNAGHKQAEGDKRTPEGWYRTSDKPNSAWWRAIAVHYPELKDADAALADGRIDAATHARIAGALARGEKPPQDTPLGGEILIHGGGQDREPTKGCVALEDVDLRSLRTWLPTGMRADVLIIP